MQSMMRNPQIQPSEGRQVNSQGRQPLVHNKKTGSAWKGERTTPQSHKYRFLESISWRFSNATNSPLKSAFRWCVA